MNSTSKMLVFDNADDFLKAIEHLQQEYNKANESKTDKGAGNYE